MDPGYGWLEPVRSAAEVSGEGWVAGDDGVRASILAGHAADWAAGKDHESVSEDGMTALVIEAERCRVR